MENDIKLELKHIASYLPYGLKVQYIGIVNGCELKEWENKCVNDACLSHPCPEIEIAPKVGFIKKIEFTKNGSCSYLIGNKVGKLYYGLSNEVKPILRPMSDLKKPLPDGTIPIVELAKLFSDAIYVEPIQGCVSNFHYFKCMFNDGFEELIIDCNCNAWYRSYFDKNQPSTGRNIINGLEVFDYLNQHHFDYRGLIERGLAIDINTVQL